jgi:hypothetical protein
MGDVSVHSRCFEKRNRVIFNGNAVVQSGYAIQLIGLGMWCDPLLPNGHWLEVK